MSLDTIIDRSNALHHYWETPLATLYLHNVCKTLTVTVHFLRIEGGALI